MPRKMLATLLFLSAAVLSGCSSTPEERIEEGLEGAREAFEKEPLEGNETAGDIRLYVPGGYEVEQPSDENNLIITDGSESYVVFLNPNEQEDSELFYNLQKEDLAEEWLVDETFEQNGRFGFTTVRKVADNRFEVVVSAGGVKMTAMSAEAEISENMEWMMKTVRSINMEG